MIFVFRVLGLLLITTLFFPTYIHAPVQAYEIEPQRTEIEEVVDYEVLEISDDTEDSVASNCYLYVQSRIPDLPLTKDLKPNSVPLVGSVAIFDYPHYAYVEKLGDKGFIVSECNYDAGECGERFVDWGDEHIIGFWYNNQDSIVEKES